MTFDGFFTRALINELSPILIGGRITKIYQPFERELQLVIRNQRQNFRLNASIHPIYFHLGLTDERPSNPTHAPMFCMLMRKHLENSVILGIQQIANDRTIIFTLTGLDELGDQQHYHLIFEMMGRHSNILLVNPKKQIIIDCIKHVAPSLNTYRGLQPGAQYIMPPANEQQVNVFDNQNLEEWANEYSAVFESGQGSRIIQGLGQLGARQIAHWMQNNNLSAFEAIQQLMNGTQSPTPTTFQDDKRLIYYYTDLSHITGERQAFSTLSTLLVNYYQQKIHHDRIKQLSGDLIQRLEQIIQRNQIKLKKLATDRNVANASELYRIKGELLKANAYQLTKGMTSIELSNYYDNNQLLTIELEPQLTPIENSQKYFKRYSKYRDSLAFIDEQERLAKEENQYLESVLIQLEQADIEDIEDIKAELTAEGYVAQKRQTVKKRAKSSSKPRRYRSSDGVMIYVGRNNLQNDALSLKTAAKNHWWLHAKNIPGSHVIIESDKPSDETITLAGELAAHYSKFSQSASVPIDMVQVKALRKPNGAKPGYVIYEGQHTIYVTPDAEHLQQFEVE